MTLESISEQTEAPVTPAPEATPAAPAPAPQAEQPAEPESLEAALAARYDEVKGDEPADDETTLELPRDEKGRFQSKNPAAKVAGEPQQASENQQEPESEAPAIPLPHSWAPELKEHWAKLPSDVQNYVAHREQQAHAMISRMGQTLKQYEPLNKVFEEQAHVFARYNMDPATWVSNLTKVQDALDRDAPSTIKWLADYYKVNLEDLVLGIQPDPAAQQANARLQELERTNFQLQRQQQLAQQQAQQAQYQSVRSGIDQYASQMPHFDELIPDIMAEIPGLRQMNPNLSQGELLHHAYERAAWANPTMRQRILAYQAQEQAKVRAEEVAKAKRIASGNVRGQATGPTPASWEDAARQAYDRMQMQ